MGKTDKYEFLTGEEILPSHQRRVIEQAKFTCSSVAEALKKKKKKKTIDEQGIKQDEALKL